MGKTESQTKMKIKIKRVLEGWIEKIKRVWKVLQGWFGFGVGVGLSPPLNYIYYIILYDLRESYEGRGKEE